MNSFSTRYEVFRAYFERVLGEACENMNFAPSVLGESMRYSLLAGGKRIRPVLFFSALEALGVPYEDEGDLAVAIECIHTYSLIHDDLPCMDDDDFRRGKPSSHKMFGEANAVLAGDALLSYAMQLLIQVCAKGERHRLAALALAEAAGTCGMLAGQSADLLYEKGGGGEAALGFIHEHKTAHMLAAPLRMAALLAGVDPAPYTAFGLKLGLLFQLTDDLLDDGESNALNAVKVYGKERAWALAEGYAEECRTILKSIPENTAFLEGVVGLVLHRNQ